ncbi:AHH domain-containing protein [Litoribacillus peritrichatus]|uniref:A nuclease family of the HNH/ENDO VII superfamily with conserved AHH n=1 Tax=Litoribacillus peritrichatus TaxID=718191 RepID=A0ABP7MNF4_9GAMM
MIPQGPFIPHPRPSNPSPLQLSIYRFELKARKYHYDKALAAPANESLAQKKNREKAFEEDWNHLQKEKERLSALALAENLKKYREESASKSLSELQREPHHPTHTLSNNLAAIAEPKPSTSHEPHHIIMGKGRWLVMEMMRARLNLHVHGIGINDPINGVWLPRYMSDHGHWATPNSAPHRPIHRYNYEDWVTEVLRANGLSKEMVLNQLKEKKRQLKNGSYPDRITQAKGTDGTIN